MSNNLQEYYNSLRYKRFINQKQLEKFLKFFNYEFVYVEKRLFVYSELGNLYRYDRLHESKQALYKRVMDDVYFIEKGYKYEAL